MWGVTALGWMLVVALAWCYRSESSWLAAACAVPALLLVFRREFPNRKRGLMYSWVGPLLIVLAHIGNVAIRGPVEICIQSAGSRYCVLAPIAVWDLGAVLVMAWLWRGYGAIALLAVAGVIARQTYNIEKAATEYPWRRWWLVPLFLVALALAKLGILGWWLHAA